MTNPNPARARTLKPLGVVLTLDDLAEFVREMAALGMPGAAEIRATPAIEVDLVNGPRLTSITAVPPAGDS